MEEKILVINPGSTSTKLAIFIEREKVWEDSIKHSFEELKRFDKIIDQLDWRQDLILKAVREAGFKLTELTACVARGGAGLDPIPGGTYYVDQTMVQDLYTGKNAEHASNLAGIIAYNLAREFRITAYTVDPVAVDEFKPIARLSGLPELPRRCQSHALNLKAVGRKTAEMLGKRWEDVNLIGVHLGGGISIAALEKGKIIDVNNANQGGPYSPERVGSLPVIDLVEYIYREKPDKDVFKKRLLGRGGLTAYLGTNDGQEVEKRIQEGDREAESVYKGMIYQIGKEIGQMAAVLKGKVDAIFITGGLAHSDYIVREIDVRVNFIAPVKVFPGAEEIEHLAAGALRVLKGEEEARDYDRARKLLEGENDQ